MQKHCKEQEGKEEEKDEEDEVLDSDRLESISLAMRNLASLKASYGGKQFKKHLK